MTKKFKPSCAISHNVNKDAYICNFKLTRKLAVSFLPAMKLSLSVRCPQDKIFGSSLLSQSKSSQSDKLSPQPLADTSAATTSKSKGKYRGIISSSRKMSKLDLFRGSFLLSLSDFLSEAAQVAVLVYSIDCLTSALRSVGYEVKNYNQVAAKIIYSIWFLSKIVACLIHFFNKGFSENKKCDEVEINEQEREEVKIQDEEEENISEPQKDKEHLNQKFQDAKSMPSSKNWLMSQFFTAFIYTVSTCIILIVLRSEGGNASGSVFAFGSAGTVMLGIATRDLASQLISGFIAIASEKVREGETIEFGDGLSGKIIKLGWLETTLRTSDEKVMTIPNTHLSNQRITNLSRMDTCHIKQVLHFAHKDAMELPCLLEHMKKEIARACPKVITDGSRPFRAQISNHKPTYLEVEVDAYFNIKPTEEAYGENRQEFLMTIHRVTRKGGFNTKLPHVDQ